MIPDRKERTSDDPAPRKKPLPPRPTIGQLFNPCREICGFYAPDIVGRQTDIADGPKRLYERSVRWAGRNGRFWYSFETMAQELGKSPRQVKRDMAELESHGLILHERRGNRKSNMYRFPYHPMFESNGSDGTSMSLHPGGGEGTDVPSDGTSMSPGEVTRMSHESYKENCIKESSSEKQEAQTDSATPRQNDDDACFSEKTKTPTSAVLDLVEAGFNSEDQDPLMGSAPLPQWFLEGARDKIHASKCRRSIGDVDLGLHPPPDLAYTTKIVEPWRGKGTLAFIDWLCSTHERGLGKKVRSSGPFGYGLFLSDSIACAQAWKPSKPISRGVSFRLAWLKSEADEREAAQRRQQMFEARVPVADAIRILKADVQVPGKVKRRLMDERFVWLMGRRTSTISPADLSDAAVAWRSCKICCNGGIVGSPLRRTLAYCDCEIGQQEHADRGDAYLSEEMDRIHATIRSRWGQACKELGLDCSANFVEQGDTKIVEHEDLVEIFPSGGWDIFCNERELKLALEYLQDPRKLRAVRPGNRSSEPARLSSEAAGEDTRRAIVDHRSDNLASSDPGSQTFRRITEADIDAAVAENRRKATARSASLKEPLPGDDSLSIGENHAAS